jgi:hypothetical protein
LENQRDALSSVFDCALAVKPVASGLTYEDEEYKYQLGVNAGTVTLLPKCVVAVTTLARDCLKEGTGA